ncbi:peptidoglycan-binding protein [Streptomyces zagrosensis]|uniref:Peptidoglycan hydrolase-like protein with peptidoglycan-binding domain n=1 Tax=Streptomyces zagrosensis TaxID=1042984 RepID=A0A7W9UY57_9ACTN|nr:peptidoglycan-binding protein [Streptomyces zagrosensis]MBB5935011.1 peptidoglycan hydrolase-like protein with peptidoglycan-binding domain [Streptomyces zagrosensis]
MRRRTGFLVGGAAVAAAALGAGALAYGGGDADDGRGELPPATVAITRADLVQSKTIDGKIDFARRRAVKSATPGTVTVSARVGATISRGQALYELDDKPVTLLYGPVPAFRDMKVGARGSDVLQLERNLVALGYGAGLYTDPRFDRATEAAVKQWQKSLNRTPSGQVGKGDVVFQPEQVTVVRADAALADQVGPETAALTVASTKPVIRAELDQADASLTAKGTKVEVTLPSGTTKRGRVAGTVQPPGSDGSDDADAAPPEGITVEVALDGGTSAVSGEDTKATASVKFVSESRKGVLTVPVEAIVALRGADGGYGLQVVQGTTSRMVRVETGMTADGRIEVSGPQIRDGLTVGVATE